MAERQMRFLSGVTGHDPSKTKALCARCGGVKAQPSAAVLAGALAPPDPPDLVAALRARTATTERAAQQVPLVTPPALPTESSIVALMDSDTVPSPNFADQQASLNAYRAGLNKKNGRG